MSSMLPFFWLGIIAFVGIVAWILSRHNREKQKESWRNLAKAHHLTFVENHNIFGKGDYVVGDFRGYPLKLETVSKRYDKFRTTCTRIMITNPWPDVASPEESISFQEAVNAFISPSYRHTLAGQLSAEVNGAVIFYEQQGIIEDQRHLEFLLAVITHLAQAYPVIVTSGGEAIPELIGVMENIEALRPIIGRLLEDIGQESCRRFAQRATQVVCPDCLTHFGAYDLELSEWNKQPCYGCRMCGQNRRFSEGSIIAILDQQMSNALIQTNGQIRVNWSARREQGNCSYYVK